MYSIGMTFWVRPGCYAEYKRRHDEIGPELAASMADNNVSMGIFRYGDQLFLHAVAPTREDWNRSREVPILDKWSEVMQQLMVTDADGNIKFQQLEPAFEFGMFKAQ